MKHVWPIVILSGCVSDRAPPCELTPQDIGVATEPLTDASSRVLHAWAGFARSRGGRVCGVLERDGAWTLSCASNGVTTHLMAITDRLGWPLVQLHGETLHAIVHGETTQWLREGAAPEDIPGCDGAIGLWVDDDDAPRVLCSDLQGTRLMTRGADGWSARPVSYGCPSYPRTASVPSSSGGGHAFFTCTDVGALDDPDPLAHILTIMRPGGDVEHVFGPSQRPTPIDVTFGSDGTFAALGGMMDEAGNDRVFVFTGRVGETEVRAHDLDSIVIPDVDAFATGRIVRDAHGRLHAVWFEQLFGRGVRHKLGYAVITGDKVERVTYSDGASSPILGGRLGSNSQLEIIDLRLEGGRAVLRGVLQKEADRRGYLATIRLPFCD